MNHIALFPNLSSCRVDFDLANSETLTACLGVALDPPKNRLHSRDELPRAERFCHVIVGAHPKTDEDVGLRVASRQHENGGWPVSLNPSADLEAINSGKHYVEDDEIGIQPFAQADAGVTVVCNFNLKALPLKAS